MKRIISAVFALMLFVSVPVSFAAGWVSVIERVKKSTARIEIFVDSEQAGYCSAFSINDTKDYFLTAYHCLGDYMLVDGHQGLAIWADPKADLMILVVPDSGDYPTLYPATDAPEQGQAIGAYGYGYGVLGTTFKSGTVSNPNVPDPRKGFDGEVWLLVDGTFIPGMSGGPVFNQKGEILSVAQMGNEYIGIGRTLNEVTARVGKYWEKR